jgi:hypothetical protein
MSIKSTGIEAIDEALRKLRNALRGLEGTEGRRLARRGARARALAAFRGLRSVIDEKYPAIIERGGGKRLQSFEARADRLKRAGWTEIDGDSAGDYATAGAPLRKVKGLTRRAVKMQRGRQADAVYLSTERRIAFYVPAWAKQIVKDFGFNRSLIRAAKNSIVERRSTMARAALARQERT